VADILPPEVAASMTDEQHRLRKEIQVDEIGLRIKKLKVHKFELLTNIKKIDHELVTLEDELKKLTKK